LKVEIVHLLEHSSGGWGVQTAAVELSSLLGFQDYNQSAFIGVGIDKYPLIYEPGTAFDYANFGFYLLGVIVAKLSGKSYEQYVKDTFWRPAGVPDDRVGIENRWFVDRLPDEAVFHMDAFQSVSDAYDQIDPWRIASAGGWIASPMDLLRVTTLFNGFNFIPDVISQSSFNEWTTPSTASGGTFCRDVFVGNDFVGYWHNGFYPGGYSTYERHDNGFEVMVMQNKGGDSAESQNAVTAFTRLFIDFATVQQVTTTTGTPQVTGTTPSLSNQCSVISVILISITSIVVLL